MLQPITLPVVTDACKIVNWQIFPDARAHLLVHFANSAFEMADEFTRNSFALQQSFASSPFGETLVASSERKAVSHETWLIIRNLLNSLRSFFCSSTQNLNGKQLTFHHVAWEQRPKSNQNIPNHCTTRTLGNFSRAWIIFHRSNFILPNYTLLHHVLFPHKQPACI